MCLRKSLYICTRKKERLNRGIRIAVGGETVLQIGFKPITWQITAIFVEVMGYKYTAFSRLFKHQ